VAAISANSTVRSLARMRRTLFSRSPTVRRHFRTSYLSKCIRTSCYFLVASIPDLPASSIRPRDFPSRATVSARDENSLLIRSFAGNYIIMRRAEATASPRPLSWQPTRLARRKQASKQAPRSRQSRSHFQFEEAYDLSKEMRAAPTSPTNHHRLSIAKASTSVSLDKSRRERSVVAMDLPSPAG